MSPEPAQEDLAVPVPLIEDLILSQGFLGAEDSTAWLRKNLIVSPAVIDDVVKKTMGQSRNHMWSAIRKLRLTASNFGPILKAARRKR